MRITPKQTLSRIIPIILTPDWSQTNAPLETQNTQSSFTCCNSHLGLTLHTFESSTKLIHDGESSVNSTLPVERLGIRKLTSQRFTTITKCFKLLYNKKTNNCNGFDGSMQFPYLVHAMLEPALRRCLGYMCEWGPQRLQWICFPYWFLVSIIICRTLFLPHSETSEGINTSANKDNFVPLFVFANPLSDHHFSKIQ